MFPAEFVVLKSDVVKVCQDVFRGCVLLNLAVGVKQHHIGRRDFALKLEEIGYSFLLCCSCSYICERNCEVHFCICMMLPAHNPHLKISIAQQLYNQASQCRRSVLEVRHKGGAFALGWLHQAVKPLLIVLCPLPDRQFCDIQIALLVLYALTLLQQILCDISFQSLRLPCYKSCPP